MHLVNSATYHLNGILIIGALLLYWRHIRGAKTFKKGIETEKEYHLIFLSPKLAVTQLQGDFYIGLRSLISIK